MTPSFDPRRVATRCALLLIAGLPLWSALPSPATLNAQRAQLPSRTHMVHQEMVAQREQIGLGARETFSLQSSLINLKGETVVRLDHRFEGHRVLGSQVIARAPLGGAVQADVRSLITGITLEAQPLLSPEQAAGIATRRLAPRAGLVGAPRVERIVFPARFLGGDATTIDPESGRVVMDRSRLVHAQLRDPFVWAYQVSLCARNAADGHLERTYFIDARTGVVLRVNDDLRHEVVPTTGTGNGLYCGTVSLPTSQMADGSYALYDTTRGTLPNPYLSAFTPDESGWTPTGMQVWYEGHDASGVSNWTSFLFQANSTNTWGNGQAFTGWGSESGVNGQTAAVDALYGMSRTWDMFRDVFGRDGLDGQGTTVFAEVLKTGTYDRDNASWSPWYKGLFLGAGSYPANPAGFGALTDLDVVAHEMMHGVTASTAQFVNSNGYEEAGLDEGTSDFFAQMAIAYAGRGADAPASEIPNSGAPWTIGARVGHGTPLRWMAKPSKDHRSADGWYDGLYYMDGHFSSGVLNRALHFLAQGASSDPSADNHSLYLPQGMAGIGNDKTARIWFTAVTQGLYSGGVGTVTFAEARRVAIEVAKYLYGNGWDCPESKAVENAFGAVNVGRAYAEAPRVQVSFKDWRDGDWIERNHFPDTGYAHKQYFPMGVAVWPRITVENSSNAAVTWSLGGPSVYNQGVGPGSLGFVTGGGKINADGSWTTPMDKGWYAITATSQADPRQFAEGRAFIINMDADQDLEQDAVDMGSISFSWYLTNALNPSHSMFNAPWVDDADVAAFVDALKSTWWNK